MIEVNNDYIGLIDSYTCVLGKLEQYIDLGPENGTTTIEDLFFQDLRDYLLYLSCCDGFISFEEADFLENIWGFI